jgi:hypothetical protein
MKDEIGGACSTHGKILVRKSEGKRTTNRLRQIWGNIKINLKEIDSEDVD